MRTITFINTWGRLLAVLLLGVFIMAWLTACAPAHTCPAYGTHYNAKEVHRQIHHQSNYNK